jgi:hypothetical protein
MYEYRTSRHVKIILRRERRKRENNGGYEPNLDILYAYMEISQ